MDRKSPKIGCKSRVNGSEKSIWNDTGPLLLFAMISKLMGLIFTVFEIIPRLLCYEIAFHPLELASFLIDINYSIDTSSDNLFVAYRQAILSLIVVPSMKYTSTGIVHGNTYSYVQHVYKLEGLKGIYRGIELKIIAYFVVNHVSRLIWQLISGKEYEEGTLSLSEELWFQSLRVLLSHPFHTTMVGCFLDFTLKQDNCSIIVMKKIYMKLGYRGFYAGVVERLFGEMVFHVSRATFSKVLRLNNKEANSVPEVIFMLARDVTSRWLAMPFLVLSHQTIAKAFK